MKDFNKLFQESITGENPFEGKLTPKFEYVDLVSFAQNKATPVYNWFYYKEGFSKDLVWNMLHELETPKGSLILDPFCGTGTTLLAAKQACCNSIGFDILPLGVFVSKVKLEDNYNMAKLEGEIRRISSLKFGKPKTKLVDIRFLDMRRVYSPYALDDIAFFKEKIMEVEDEKIRNFLLLGLMSIVSQASNVMKDGGVLKVVRKKHLPPVRHLLRNKLRRMFKDLKNQVEIPGVSWDVRLGDARNLPLEDESIDFVVTSPPYLNFVDYTKIYALELGLLVSSAKELDELRKKSLRSHVGAEYKKEDVEWSGLQPLLDRVTKSSEGDRIPLVVEGYLKDLFLSVRETERVLKKEGNAVYVVANAALPGITVDVDLMLAEMGQKLGLSVEGIWVANARWADVHGITKERPVRESIVILKKNKKDINFNAFL